MSVRHKKGSFNLKHILNNSKYNERVETILYIPQIDDHIKLVQIAGQFAKRIVTYADVNDVVHRGDIIGMIKLGYRVDLFLPHNKMNIMLNVGDTVIGNKTIIGELSYN
jgi:phosphatidylserine decarboxylase